MQAASQNGEKTQPTPKSKSGAVAEQITVAIQGGEYGLGDNRLSGRELAEEPNFGPVAIQEAISVPQFSGIVSNVPERVMFVGSMTTDGETPNAVDPLESTATFECGCELDGSSNRQRPAERPAPEPMRTRPSGKCSLPDDRYHRPA